MTTPTKCKWVEDGDGNWNTQCEQVFVVIDGKPDDNGMKFCSYCGEELVQVDYEDPKEDDE
jgi:hypothetical protein